MTSENSIEIISVLIVLTVPKILCWIEKLYLIVLVIFWLIKLIWFEKSASILIIQVFDLIEIGMKI